MDVAGVKGNNSKKQRIIQLLLLGDLVATPQVWTGGM